MVERPACVICDEVLTFSWTDTHGVGQCVKCGAPYRIIHYDENRNRVERPPQFMLYDEFAPFLRRAFAETGAKYPARWGFSFSDSYDVATNEDASRMKAWLDAHDQEIDAALKPVLERDENAAREEGGWTGIS